jgi:predicted DNA-binding transcriptional regulator
MIKMIFGRSDCANIPVKKKKKTNVKMAFILLIEIYKKPFLIIVKKGWAYYIYSIYQLI